MVGDEGKRVGGEKQGGRGEVCSTGAGKEMHIREGFVLRVTLSS